MRCNVEFICRSIRAIKNDKEKDKAIRIKKALCYVILPNYDEFVKYCDLKNSKYSNFYEFLASLLNIDCPTTQTIIEKFSNYKNIIGDDIIPQCMEIKLDI